MGEQRERANFCVMVLSHTEDLHKVLPIPETLRFLVGCELDRRGLQEEVDYTLDVYRTDCDKDVSTHRIAMLEAENATLKATRDWSALVAEIADLKYKNAEQYQEIERRKIGLQRVWDAIKVICPEKELAIVAESTYERKELEGK